METRNETDVLVCGAGATGLVLAIELARRGVRFQLVEVRERPFHGSRGKGLQPRSLKISPCWACSTAWRPPAARTRHCAATTRTAAMPRWRWPSPVRPRRPSPTRCR